VSMWTYYICVRATHTHINTHMHTHWESMSQLADIFCDAKERDLKMSMKMERLALTYDIFF